MTTLLSPLKGSKPDSQELAMLRGDSQLIVVAGRYIRSGPYLVRLTDLFGTPVILLLQL